MQTSNLLFPIVWTATEDLTEAELVALNEAAQAGRDPHSLGGYSRMNDLFTEDGGSHMHRETRIALAAVTLSSVCPKSSGSGSHARQIRGVGAAPAGFSDKNYLD